MKKKSKIRKIDKNREIKGVSQIIFPVSIFIFSFFLQLSFSLFFEELNITENIFHLSVIILFLVSFFQYKKEREENKIHYLISYWIVAIIFLTKFLFKISWYFI